MIEAVIYKNKDNDVSGFCIKGHAGYAQKGKDIVCAAVSVVAFTALGALDELVGINSFSEEDGKLLFFMPRVDSEKHKTAKIILETMVIGLKQIEVEYKQFLNVKTEEV